MNAERWQRVRALVERALEVPEEGRARWIAAQCGHDIELEHRVAEIARASDRAPAFLDRPAAATFATGAPGAAGAEPIGIGTTVAGYRIDQQIASGGMGTVYRASRDGATVALKVVKAGLEGHDVRARFEAESATLAALDHPDIVRCLGAGSLPDGRPYLVMELVDGRPVDEFCREQSVSLDARLQLMQAICAAVHAAHRALVVHRDLKPQNVLVTADGRPKLCDFGVAKLLTPTESSLERREPTVGAPLTPRYAAPEQLAGGPITTACDVFALGVLFEDLLEPAHVRARPDLATVLAMARRAEPARRYPSVAQLADDLARVERGLPVVARPDSFSYRVSRFVLRNRVASALGLVAVLASILAALSTWISLERTRDGERLAWRAHAQAISVASFYRQLLDGVEAAHLEAADLARELDERAATVAAELIDQPEAEGRVRAEIGYLYLRLGQAADARPHLVRALELARTVRGFGQRDREQLESLLAQCANAAVD